MFPAPTRTKVSEGQLWEPTGQAALITIITGMEAATGSSTKEPLPFSL